MIDELCHQVRGRRNEERGRIVRAHIKLSLAVVWDGLPREEVDEELCLHFLYFLHSHFTVPSYTVECPSDSRAISEDITMRKPDR